MKLVDILARELKVWPDQYYQIYQDSGGYLIGTLSNGDLEDFDMDDLPFDPVTIAWDGNNAVIERAEWQAAVDALNADKCEHSYANNIGCPECGELNAPKVVEWDGVGDPPVGVVCQYSVLNGPWYTCEVGYSFFDGEHRCFVIKCKHLGFEQVCRIDPGSEGSVEFRPFRTAEQVAAEEREKAIEDMLSLFEVAACKQTYDMLGGIAAIYDANYRKQVAK